MDLSIVATLYRSAPYLREFHSRLTRAAEAISEDFEIILVNDGSPDESLDIAVELQKEDARLVVIDLSRNFGHHKAMMTGLTYSQGNRVFLIDSDLEEQPEILIEFAQRWNQGDCDVVYGVQARRKGRFVERHLGALFYAVFNRLASIKIPRDLVTVRLMSRRYVDALVQHRDREIFIAGLWTITGFRQVALPIEKLHKGKSSYTAARRFLLIVDAITAFSSKPLHAIFYLGMGISCSSLVAALYLVISQLFFQQHLTGWTSLIVSIWFLGGLMILFQGMIGIYLSKIYSETKDRPYTIVRAVLRSARARAAHAE
jgi:putative glycosyltransferase